MRSWMNTSFCFLLSGLILPVYCIEKNQKVVGHTEIEEWKDGKKVALVASLR